MLREQHQYPALVSLSGFPVIIYHIVGCALFRKEMTPGVGMGLWQCMCVCVCVFCLHSHNKGNLPACRVNLTELLEPGFSEAITTLWVS